MESPGREYSLSQGLLEAPVRYPRVNLSALPCCQVYKENKRFTSTHLKGSKFSLIFFYFAPNAVQNWMHLSVL